MHEQTDKHTCAHVIYTHSHRQTIRYGGCSTFHVVVITFDKCVDECARSDVRRSIFNSLLLFICVCNVVYPCGRRETELISSLWVWCQRLSTDELCHTHTSCHFLYTRQHCHHLVTCKQIVPTLAQVQIQL